MSSKKVKQPRDYSEPEIDLMLDRLERYRKETSEAAATYRGKGIWEDNEGVQGFTATSTFTHWKNGEPWSKYNPFKVGSMFK